MSTVEPRTHTELLECVVQLNSKLVTSNLEFAPLFENRAAFKAHLQQQMMVPAEPTNQSFSEWQVNAKPARLLPPDQATCWLLAPQKAAQLEKPIYKLLHILEQHPLPLGKALKGFSPKIQEEIIAYLVDLEKKGLLSITPAQRRPSSFAASAAVRSAGFLS
jgi:hypothetical protein